jgi:hypothetical protein
VGKFKLAKGRSKPASNKSAIPCLILIIGVIVLISLLFYIVLKSSG